MDDRSNTQRQRAGRLTPGLILIGLGILFLLEQFFPTGNWFLLILGLAFFISYFVTRRDGLLWPAGVLTGLGASIAIAENLRLDGPIQAGAILLGLSAGFFSIYVIDQAFTPPTPAAPLWAGAGTGVFGVLLTLLGLGILPESLFELIGRLWPLLLILAGLWIVLGAIRGERRA